MNKTEWFLVGLLMGGIIGIAIHAHLIGMISG